MTAATQQHLNNMAQTISAMTRQKHTINQIGDNTFALIRAKTERISPCLPLKSLDMWLCGYVKGLHDGIGLSPEEPAR